MTTELFYLLLTAILTGMLWIPVVTGYVLSRGPLKPSDYKVAPTSPLPAWVNRANRTQVNAVENLATFAPVVLIAHAARVSTSVTARYRDRRCRLLLCARRACRDTHQRIQSFQGSNRIVYGCLDRVSDIRDRSAAENHMRESADHRCLYSQHATLRVPDKLKFSG